jgi:poly(A) polymerase
VEIIRRLRDAGWEAYLVGGIVRDLLLGRAPHDLDIVTSAPPDAVAALFPRSVPTGAEFGVVTVVADRRAFQVATFRREGPYLDGRRPSFVEYADLREDILRRDFTVNALVYDPLTDRILDFTGGLADLERRTLRTVGDPAARFGEDRLRLLRAVRFATELQFTIDPATLEAITALAPTISGVSAERVRDELLRILIAPERETGVRLLQSTGLLAVVLPEVAAMAGVPQPPDVHPEGDVLTHTCLALRHLADPSSVLALATLLHDVGKPPTLTVADRIRFHGHAEAGARIAERICRRLRLPAADTGAVVTLVRDHLRIGDLPQMRPGKATRFLRRADFLDLLELHRVDCLASHGDLGVYRWAAAARAALDAAGPPPPRLVTGDDLIALGYAPGPQFAEMLDAADVAQAEGEIQTAEEGRAWILARFPAGGGRRRVEPPPGTDRARRAPDGGGEHD